MAAKYNNRFAFIKSWQITFVVIKNVITITSFDQKSTVVNVGYFHILIRVQLNQFYNHIGCEVHAFCCDMLEWSMVCISAGSKVRTRKTLIA